MSRCVEVWLCLEVCGGMSKCVCGCVGVFGGVCVCFCGGLCCGV